MMDIIDHQYRISQLKNKITAARKELEQAWELNGKTNPAVLEAGEVFDQLINEYEQLVGGRCLYERM